MSGVPVEIKLDIDGDDAAVKRKVVTNSAVYGTATFKLPSAVESNEVRVYATAIRGPFQEETYIDFKFPDRNRVTLSTDKPLYQPGQTAHMRVTVFGPNKRALANTPVKLTIEDEESEEQFHQTVTTSRFGVASADWDIPQKLRLGDYLIKAAVRDEDYSRRAKIRVSHYDLPTYSVSVTPDRTYFLPGQDANVEVRADYLFGKPVQHAKVRVVRRDEWEWNYRDQKWEVTKTEPVEGQFDASGKFIAHVSLKKEFENFRPNRWRRFQDLELAAYVTDLSTGRTEQRRFQLRLSALPIPGCATVATRSQRPRCSTTITIRRIAPLLPQRASSSTEPKILVRLGSECRTQVSSLLTNNKDRFFALHSVQKLFLSFLTLRVRLVCVRDRYF
jgi:hypothetical protein